MKLEENVKNTILLLNPGEDPHPVWGEVVEKFLEHLKRYRYARTCKKLPKLAEYVKNARHGRYIVFPADNKYVAFFHATDVKTNRHGRIEFAVESFIVPLRRKHLQEEYQGLQYRRARDFNKLPLVQEQMTDILLLGKHYTVDSFADPAPNIMRVEEYIG